MHELSVTQGIYNLVIQEAEKNNAGKVCQVTLKMGAACDYLPEIIQDYFDILSENTIASGAKIVVETVPITMHCEACDNQYSTKHYNPFCPKCSSHKTKMITGNEFYLENIEIED